MFVVRNEAYENSQPFYKHSLMMNEQTFKLNPKGKCFRSNIGRVTGSNWWGKVSTPVDPKNVQFYGSADKLELRIV